MSTDVVAKRLAQFAGVFLQIKRCNFHVPCKAQEFVSRLETHACAKLPPTEVVARLHLAGVLSLRQTDYLKFRGIKHIFNVAEPEALTAVTDGDDALQSMGFELKNWSEPRRGLDLARKFEEASSIIARGREVGGILVFCVHGQSRSATFCMAHLMLHEGWNLAAAFRLVHSGRPLVKPDKGLWRQLRWLESEIESGRISARSFVLNDLTLPDAQMEQRASDCYAWMNQGLNTRTSGATNRAA